MMQRKTTRNLLCELSDEEKRRESEVLAEKIGELEQLQSTKREINSQYTKDIKLLSKQVLEQANVVKTGKAERSVACVIEFDTRNERATVRRSDTQEIVEVRKMTEDELQHDLFPDEIYDE